MKKIFLFKFIYSSSFKKVLFWILLLTGFFLRFKGIFHWVHSDGGSAHSDSHLILHQVMSYFKGGSSLPIIPTYPLMIYLFTGLLFLVDRIVGLGGIGPWIVGTEIHLGMYEATMIAVVFCSLMATATLAVVYKIGKKIYGEWGGLGALLFFVFSPIHILNAHYPYADVLATFFIALIILSAIKIYEGGSIGLYVGAGILWGLAVATKQTGLPAFLPVVLAHLLSKGKKIKRGKQRYFLRIVLFFFVALTVFFSLTPYFIKDIHFFVVSWAQRAGNQYGHGTITLTKEITGSIFEFQKLLSSYGIGLILLFIFSLFLNPQRRAMIVLASYPILYFFSLAMNRFIDERYMDPLSPFVALVPLGFLFWGYQKLYRLKLVRYLLISVLFFAILIQPVYSSLELVWLLGQKDTRVWAEEWMKNNLPPKSKVMMLGGIYQPKIGEFSEAVSPQSQTFDEAQKKADFYSATGLRTWKSSCRDNSVYLNLSQYYTPLKHFELKDVSATNFFHPSITLFKFNLRKSDRQKMIYLPKPVIYGDSHEFIFCENNLPYGKEPLGGNLSGTPFQRVAISTTPLRTIGLQVFVGPFSGKIKTSLCGKVFTYQLGPYQERWIESSPARSFPFFKWIYHVLIKSDRNLKGGFQLFTDPYEFGVAALQGGQFDLAVQNLLKALQDAPHPKDILYWLAVAYVGLGDMDKASSVFDAASKKGSLSEWEKLLSTSSGKRYDEKFKEMFDIDPDFYQNSYAYRFNSQNLFHKKGVGKNIWVERENGEEIKIKYHSGDSNSSGFLIYGPYQFFPRGAYEAVFCIKARIHDRGHKPVAQIEVGGSQGETIKQRFLKIENFKSEKFQEFRLRFFHNQPWEALEFRVKVFHHDVWVDDIKVIPDLRGALRHNLEQFYQAHAKIFEKRGEISQAIQELQKIVRLNPNNVEIWNNLGRLQLLKGDLSEAEISFRKVLKKVPRHKEALEALSKIDESDISKKEISNKIEELTPSQKTFVSFDDGIDFLGLDLPKKKFKQGEKFDIHYYWQCRSAVRGVYTVFVHFQKDSSLFQQDHVPLNGKYLTRAWKVGEIIREDTQVSIPTSLSSGCYQIKIGLWNPKGRQERVKILNTDLPYFKEAVTVGTIEIE